jgi:hypothetical protein
MQLEAPQLVKLSNPNNPQFFNDTLQTIDFTNEQINHNKLGHSFRTYKDSSDRNRKYYSKIMEKKNNQNLQSREKV